jgi:ATP-dependent Clp protease ATP-binding subunit ClpA
VLLLDEIEKAHQDIYNILLQVMDYASLTDNKGRKADFRNVVLIMTSNAGAQYAGQSVGFDAHVSRGEAMMKQVKKTFKPEFINRLSGTVVFRDMDMPMAELILDKKLRELQQKLTAKSVTLELTTEARRLLLQKGFTKEYGAREMDRVIAQMLKPLLMREILFGQLKQGGVAQVGVGASKDNSAAGAQTSSQQLVLISAPAEKTISLGS